MTPLAGTRTMDGVKRPRCAGKSRMEYLPGRR